MCAIEFVVVYRLQPWQPASPTTRAKGSVDSSVRWLRLAGEHVQSEYFCKGCVLCLVVLQYLQRDNGNYLSAIGINWQICPHSDFEALRGSFFIPVLESC